MRSASETSIESARSPRMVMTICRNMAFLLVIVSVLMIVRVFNPLENGFYPRCIFNYITGAYCPGCGTLRCLHALLHGNLKQALAYNMLTVLCLPFLIAWALNRVYSEIRGKALVNVSLQPWMTRALLVVIFAYWLLRNLPIYPFSLLAPHPL
jgi:hypothetical protein